MSGRLRSLFLFPQTSPVFLDADNSLLPPSTRVLVAVSGGADSMALLLWLREMEREIVVGHVNHALDELRGGQCARDEAWLRARCASLEVLFASETISLVRSNGHVNEAVARQGRYAALERLAGGNGCDAIATAHTASDALEGLMLALGRGAGVRGWSGFSPLRTTASGLRLARPFWKLGRDATRAWLRFKGEEWLEDASNESELFRRNRVRGEVVPLLSDIFGRSSDELARGYALNAELLRDEEAWMDAEATSVFGRLMVKREEGIVALDGIVFRTLPIALQRRVLRLGAVEIEAEAAGVERAKIETLRLACVQNSKRAVWTWRKNLRAEWTGQGAGNRLRFWRV